MELAEETQSTRLQTLLRSGSIDVNQRWDRTPRRNLARVTQFKELSIVGMVVLKRADKNRICRSVKRVQAELQEFTG